MKELTRVSLSYSGGLANEHLLEADQFGESIIGAARTYYLISQTIADGRVPGARTAPATKALTGTPQPGSVLVDVVIISIAQAGILGPQAAGQWEVLKEAAGIATKWSLEAMSKIWSKDDSALKMSLDFADKVVQQSAALQKQAMDLTDANAVRQHEVNLRLLDILDRAFDAGGNPAGRLEHLADLARPAAKRMVQPVGRSCNKQSHGFHIPDSQVVVFDTDTAESIRTNEEDVKDDAREYTLFFRAVDTITATARVEFSHESPTYRAKILDPSVRTPASKYTHALDTGMPLRVMAEAVMDSAGQIKSFNVLEAF